MLTEGIIIEVSAVSVPSKDKIALRDWSVAPLTWVSVIGVVPLTETIWYAATAWSTRSITFVFRIAPQALGFSPSPCFSSLIFDV